MSKQYTIQRTRTQAHLPETLCYLAYHILRYSIINMVKFGNTCSIERAFFMQEHQYRVQTHYTRAYDDELSVLNLFL